jgi:hypothetical protein
MKKILGNFWPLTFEKTLISRGIVEDFRGNVGESRGIDPSRGFPFGSGQGNSFQNPRGAGKVKIHPRCISVTTIIIY